jgi:hypothetical protein
MKVRSIPRVAPQLVLELLAFLGGELVQDVGRAIEPSKSWAFSLLPVPTKSMPPFLLVMSVYQIAINLWIAGAEVHEKRPSPLGRRGKP